VRVPDPRAHAAGKPGAHAVVPSRSSPRFQLVDHLEQGIVAAIVTRSGCMIGWKVTDQAELDAPPFSPGDRHFAFRRFQKRPSLDIRSGWRFPMACTYSW